ncbi:MAG TPA: DEAD/DEAH box helicase [Opitutaceae bacterium]|nr:DEAD/DEAH box helicase [Opitutaceae bacterium]
MQRHGPKRVYTPQSLESWFGKLEHEWTANFSGSQLEEGRRMYRDSEIREIELTATDAIVHRKVEKKEEYAVIEWSVEGFSVRSSSTDAELARAIAVAGLHEIEELVADELTAVPDNLPAAAPATGATAAAGTAANGKTNGTARPLVLEFQTRSEGLAFQAFWVGPDKNRVSALGQANGNGHGVPDGNGNGNGHGDGQGQANGNGNGNGIAAAHVSSGERGKLICLTAYARKAHFHYHQESHAYILDLLKEIPEFLRTTLPVWRRYFTVQLDEHAAHLAKGEQAVEIEAHADQNGGPGLELRWLFRAGERLLTEDQVAAVLRRGGGAVILPNIGIVTLAPDKWESLSQWRRTVEETAPADGKLPPYLIFSLFTDTRLKVTVSPAVDAWRQSVLAPPPAPPELPEFLRPYQRRGVEWLHHLCTVGCHGLLADEMGLGKTLQVLTLLATRPLPGLPHLVVCPASVVPVWREEMARFFPQLQCDVLKTGHDFTTRRDSVVWLASYTQLRKHKHLLDQVEFGYAVLDEGQFIKNPDAKVSHASCSIRARHRLVLTGTPLENRQLDLWSIFRYLLPGLLGTRQGFETVLGADRMGTLTRLRHQLAPFSLRRTKDEVAQELPPKVEMDLLCPLTDLQRTEYARICTEGLTRLGDDIGTAMRERSFGFLALLTRLRQACCDPDLLPWLKAPVTESGKLNLLVDKLAEIVGSGHKVVVFSQFVMFLNRVREVLAANFPDLARFELTGMTLDRQKPVQAFQGAVGPAVMLVSLKAAGTGITLHAADYVFLLDPWWNPAVEAQAVDRVHRLGQTNTVFVYRMVTGGTIEERIQALKTDKKMLFDRVVGDMAGDFDLSRHFASLHTLIELATPEAEQ